jgi:hypothetical protein
MHKFDAKYVSNKHCFEKENIFGSKVFRTGKYLSRTGG